MNQGLFEYIPVWIIFNGACNMRAVPKMPNLKNYYCAISEINISKSNGSNNNVNVDILSHHT